MKNILFIVLLFTIIQTYSQVDKEKNMQANIESLKVDVNSLEELKEINWKEIEDAFKENDPESDIILKVSLNSKKSEKVKLNYSYKVDGKAKDVNKLILKLKKGISIFKKISKN